MAAAFRARLAELSPPPGRYRRPAVDAEAADRVVELRNELRAHPCHGCPDREQHARWAERALKLERENAQLAARTASRTNTIANHFDRICRVLESLGYLGGEHGDRVSEAGRTLARIYAELDLVAAECIRAGVFAELTVPQLAAVLSALVYEARGGDDGTRRPRMPDERSNEAIGQVRRVWREVSLVERDHRLPRGPEPDIGFAEVVYAWAAGESLTEVLVGSELTAGDFVRWVRQVADFAGQVADAAGPGPLRTVARNLVSALRRGVVTYSVEDEPPDDLTGGILP